MGWDLATPFIIDLQVAAHGHDLLHDLLQLGRIGFVVQAPDGLGDDLEFSSSHQSYFGYTNS